MSHPVTYNGAKFKNIQCLCQAFEALGWGIVRNARIRTYPTAQKPPYAYVAVNPTGPESNHYDVGLELNAQEEWTLNGDFSMSNIYELLGAKFERVQDRYNVAFYSLYANEHNGVLADLEVLADGTIIGIMELEVEI